MTDWERQLDRFALHLADQRRALLEGRPEDVQGFEPQPLGPLPPAAVARARALAAEADALTTDIAAATAAAARQLRIVTAVQVPQRRTPSYIDQRG